MSMMAEHTLRRIRPVRPAPVPAGATLALSEGVITADHAFEVRSVNGSAAEFLGWSSSQGLADHLNDTSWSILPASTQRDMRAALAHRRRWEGSVALVRRDGSTVESVVTACALNSSAGVASGVVVVIRPLLAINADDRPADEDTFRVEGLPGQFLLRYQPEVDLATGALTSAEALLRWRHPALGILSPGATLSEPMWQARLSGLESWAQGAACRQASAWADRDQPLRISVNLSTQQLVDPTLISRLRLALASNQLSPSCLAVEVDYTDVLLRPTLVQRVARDLAEERIALIIDRVDDTLPEALVRDLPVSALKLAPATTRAIGHRDEHVASVADLVAFAREIGADTVAGLVETAEDADVLRSLGIDRAFGHHFGPPTSATDLVAEEQTAPGRRPSLQVVR